ncbi:MAG: hypothetical protein K6A90_07010 [Lachnospiraceae bacterium]|nr:hypothetical protein [Lachnospiraceae bacterium]
MMRMTIIEKIIKKNHCSKTDAAEIADGVRWLDDKLKPIFDAWINDKPYTDISISGYSIESLINDYDMEFTGALLTLDWICKDPNMAISALRSGIK